MTAKRTKLLLTLGILGAVVLLMIRLIPAQDQQRQMPLPPLAANAPCADVLLQLDDATTAWAETNQMKSFVQPDAEKLKPYFKSGLTPACPQGGKITYGTLSLATTCSLHGHAADKRPMKEASNPPRIVRRLLHFVGLGATITGSGNACIANLRMIDGAKQQWALEYKKTLMDIPSASDIAPYLLNSQIPACPHNQGHGKYILNAVSTDPQCTRGGVGHTL
jgi:hypothetical protein